MAKSSSGQSGRGTRDTRQRSVTIDLPAEEVARGAAEPDAPEAAASTGEAKPVAETKAEAQAPAPAAKDSRPSPAPAAANAETAKSAPAAKADAAAPEKQRSATSVPEAKAQAAGNDASRGKDAPAAPSAAAQAGAGTTAQDRADKSRPSSAPPKTPPPSSPQPPPQPLPPRRSIVPVLVAGLIGGLVGALAVFLLAVAGLFAVLEDEGVDLAGEFETLRSEFADFETALQQQALAPLREDLAALEQFFAEAQDTAPLQAAVDEAATALGARITELEGEIAAIGDAVLADGEGAFVMPDLSGLESEVEALSQRLDALAADLAANLAASGVDSIAAIETRIAELGRELAAIGVALENVSALGPAVAADALAASVESGRPFTAEFAALSGLGADAEVLAQLQPYAETGLPTRDALRARFETEVAAIDLSPPVAEGASALDRLIGSARGLVEVRPADPTAGADPAAVVTRIRGALATGDLATALAEWAALPEAIKVETADWAALLETRVAADALVAALRADALAPFATAGSDAQ